MSNKKKETITKSARTIHKIPNAQSHKNECSMQHGIGHSLTSSVHFLIKSIHSTKNEGKNIYLLMKCCLIFHLKHTHTHEIRMKIQVILLLKSLKLFNTCTRFDILLQIASHVLAYTTACINPLYAKNAKFIYSD